MSKSLIAFYSRADENYVCGMIKSLTEGNTEVVDMFKLEQAKPYSANYNECIEQARRDQNTDARPALKTFPESLDDYEVIYLGFPNYWNTMPMAVFTFLEHFDFSGKTIKPFCTHEGSGLGKSIGDIKKLCPKADVRDGLAIRGCSAEKSDKTIKEWI